MFPVSEPVEKLEGKLQTTGEAKYVDDIPKSGRLDWLLEWCRDERKKSNDWQNMLIFKDSDWSSWDWYSISPLPSVPGELSAALVLSTIASARLDKLLEILEIRIAET